MECGKECCYKVKKGKKDVGAASHSMGPRRSIYIHTHTHTRVQRQAPRPVEAAR